MRRVFMIALISAALVGTGLIANAGETSKASTTVAVSSATKASTPKTIQQKKKGGKKKKAGGPEKPKAVN